MTTRSRYVGGRLGFYEGTSYETLSVMAPLAYYDDFIGAGSAVIPAAGSAENGVDWVKKIVGAAPPTVAAVANGAGGRIACTLTSASQAQEAGFYHGDALAFDATKGLIWEGVIALTVLPSAAEVQTVFGMSAAWNAAPDSVAYYLEFGATASGAIVCRSQDGVTQNSLASGVTVVAAAFHTYRIDATDVTNVRFQIDGADVAPSVVTFAATGANAILQPMNTIMKASGTGVGTLTVDSVKIWTNRS